MTPDMLNLFFSIVAPAAAAYVSVKVGIAQALAKAEIAMGEANRAHERIDALMHRTSNA